MTCQVGLHCQYHIRSVSRCLTLVQRQCELLWSQLRWHSVGRRLLLEACQQASAVILLLGTTPGSN